MLSYNCSAWEEVHTNYTLITGQTKSMLFYVKGNVPANFAFQTRDMNIKGREPSLETAQIRGPGRCRLPCHAALLAQAAPAT